MAHMTNSIEKVSAKLVFGLLPSVTLLRYPETYWLHTTALAYASVSCRRLVF